MSSLVVALVGLVAVTGVRPAAATAALPGIPGTPVAVGMQGAAALRWSAPADAGSPPLTHYRVEANGGSGWATAPSVPGVASITAGSVHTCALLDDGTVKCWGYNGNGQLGLGSTAGRGDGPGQMGDALPAVDLGTGRTAVAITAGLAHTCALLDNATVRCWGANGSGQLGQGGNSNRGDGPGEMGDNLPAVDLGTGHTAVAITAGGNHTCALLDNRTVKCWGYNSNGELGLGDTANRGDVPGQMGDALPAVDLGTGHTAVAITASYNHTCALLDNATLKCWGNNYAGQLGLGDTANRGDGPGEMGDALPAVDLGTGRTAIAITAGGDHTCALLDDATMRCWGYNGYGELGLGSTAVRGDGPGQMGDALPAVDLGTGRTAVTITAGYNHTCALLDNGTLKCWGYNGSGQLGLGSTAVRGDGPGEMGDALPAVDLGTGRTAVAITAGDAHTCALLDNATMKCWGHNGYGQLGQGDTANRGAAPGEMGDALPAVDLRSGDTAVANIAVVRLAPGTYDLRVVAVSSAGDSTPSGASAPVVVPGPPGAPSGVVGTVGDGEVGLVWSAPVDDGGAAISDYEVSVFDGSGGAATGVTGAAVRMVGSATSAFTFTGLTNGTSYTFEVAAVNSIGTGAQSALSASVIPATVPGAPSHARAAAVASGSLRVRFWAAASNGSAISSYRAACTSSNGGVLRSKTGSASPLTVTHLTTGKRYTCTVRAINSRGAGAWSVPSAAVIVGSPGAPTHIRAVKVAAGSLRVTFRAGATNGRKITSFTAKCESSNGGVTRAKSGAVSPLTVTRLTHGKKYTCTVRATNSRGAGAWSAPSAAITP